MGEVKMDIMLFFLPLILGNVLHMVVVKKDLFRFLGVPLSVRLFGRNKTWRGFILLPLLTGLVAFIGSRWLGPFTHSAAYDTFVGAGLGFVYMLFELPNSFIKRKAGIANGEKAKRFKYLQLFMDKADSLIGVLIFYYLTTWIPFRSVIIIFAVSLGIHFFLSYMLVLLKIKKSL